MYEIKEFKGKLKRQDILDPDKELYVTTLSGKAVLDLKLFSGRVTITRKTLKHIVESRESRKEDIDYIILSIPEVLNNPTKISDNFQKRKNSFLFARMNGKGKAVILEISKTESRNKVVSAFFMDNKTYKKLKNILGRADVPPSTLF